MLVAVASVSAVAAGCEGCCLPVQVDLALGEVGSHGSAPVGLSLRYRQFQLRKVRLVAC